MNKPPLELSSLQSRILNAYDHELKPGQILGISKFNDRRLGVTWLSALLAARHIILARGHVFYINMINRMASEVFRNYCMEHIRIFDKSLLEMTKQSKDWIQLGNGHKIEFISKQRMGRLRVRGLDNPLVIFDEFSYLCTDDIDGFVRDLDVITRPTRGKCIVIGSFQVAVPAQVYISPRYNERGIRPDHYQKFDYNKKDIPRTEIFSIL